MSVEVGRALDELVEPPPRSGRRRPPVALLVAGVAVATATAVPLVYLVIRSAGSGWQQIATTVWDARTLQLVLRTCLLALAVTGTAVAIGVPLAWLTTRTDLPGRRVVAVLTAMPLVVPSYVCAYAFIAALGPTGTVSGWLAPFGVERLPAPYGFPGAWFVLTVCTYPYVLLTVRAVVRNLDPSLEDAARSLGYPARRVLTRVVLPQLRPAIAAGGLLVALYTLHDLGGVALLRYDTFTRAIYTSYQGSFDRGRAATLSLLLVALVAIALWFERRARGSGPYHRIHGGAPRAATVVLLGRWRWPAFAACAALIGVALALPLAVIGTWFVRGLGSGIGLGRAAVATAHTLEAGAVTAVIAVLAAWPLAVLAVRFPGRRARSLERISYVGYALPGLVVALSLVFIAIRVAPALYQTMIVLVVAYVVLFLPQAGGALRASLLQVSPGVEDAAHSLGASRARTTLRIVAPLVRPGVAAGAALVALTTMKELPATLLLAPTGFRTLATEVWSAADAARFDLAAAPALLLIAAASVPLLALVLGEREVR